MPFQSSFSFLVCLLAFPLLAWTQVEAIPGTPLRVDWPAFVARGDIALTAPPADSYQGLILGNGDIAVSLFGPPDRLTLHIGKNDLWDYRDAMDAKRAMPHKDFLAKYANANQPVGNYLFDEKADAHNVDIRKTYEDAAPSSKPAGQLRFRFQPRTSAAKYHATLQLWNAEAQAHGLETFVCYPRNLIVATFEKKETGDFDIELARHKDAAGMISEGPSIGVAGREMWVRYRFPADPATYPNGFEYAMVARVLTDQSATVDLRAVTDFAKVTQSTWRGGAVETVESACVAHVSNVRGPVTVLLAVITTRDDVKPFDRARAEVEHAAKRGLEALRQEHRTAWHDFWKRSCVFLENHETLNRNWSFGQYLLACAFRPGRVMPGLFGAWAWEDFPPFGNDYYWDYNTQQAIWGAFSSNHVEHVEPYVDAALQTLPAARNDARETYGIDGAKFFLTTYPRNYAHNPFPLLHYDKMMSLNGWVAHPLWWKYLYTQDREYLRTRGYPLIRDAAKFYASYVTRASDGKYEVFPTAAWDVDFTPGLKFNRNFPMDLSLAKYLLRASARASEILDVDPDLRSRFRDIADNLHDYPSANGVFTAYEGSTANYHFPLATMMIFPGDDIGLHSPTSIRETAVRTLAPMKYNSDEQLLTAMHRVRMGIDDTDAFEKQLAIMTRPNGTLSYPGQNFFWVHGAGNTLWTNESIVQSYTGDIRIAPVKRNVSARFANLRTVGAFLVSGEIKPGGEVTWVVIESERGGTCRLVRPWPGDLRIRSHPSLQIVPFDSADDDVLTFKTDPGACYLIDRIGSPLEKMPILNVP